MDPMLLEYVIGQFLSSLKDVAVQKSRRGPDFALKTEDGKCVLIEVKASPPDRMILSRIRKQVEQYDRSADRFVLVTPSDPNASQVDLLNTVFAGSAIPASWIGVNGLPHLLGVRPPGDLNSPDTFARLQLSTLVKNIERYVTAPIGPSGKALSSKAFAAEWLPLTRQFSHRTIGALSAIGKPAAEQLNLAKRTENVTVVLSDIVNFSSLVTASRPEELKEAMDRYYRLSREAVFKHGGMLDKFIGDAVLSIFGYPIPGTSDSINALKFAEELIDIGKEVLTGWQENLNAVIDTGTRVGIATGDLWPINIGTTDIEITLLGDTINLAARLEKNSQRNRSLIDNRTRTKASKEDAAFIDSLDLIQVQIPPGDAKGQQFTIRAWTRNTADSNG